MVPVSEGLFLKLPAGPACERCGGRTYVAAIEPHPRKQRRTRHTFECPQCYHLTKVVVTVRGQPLDELARMNQFVANASFRIERQTTLIRRLRHLGRDVTRAEALLEVLQESRDALVRYRDHVASSLCERPGLDEAGAI
ncbi:hypothetical protein FHP25_00035 [Vineibacter terrae]|uniref:Uncharacterized protein n=1 Tax=Vineibacter terrae TaxID=2586908 RepID=A0A5C8PW66_9HYPH|nr:hypothetical protein [Vineibacter terrae]TXL82130.1 hypothetical protein FHP25_00035 [Vineibacter terrae]